MQTDDNWFFVAPVAQDEQGVLPNPSLETLQRLFDERVGLPDVRFSDPTWLSIWRPNIRMVDHYRSGRVLLAGDAAHVHSPAGGQGMNTGIQDAYNLAWKLACVLNGAPDDLLDTYQTERLPIAQGVLATTAARQRAFTQRDADGKPVGAQAIANTMSGKDAFADITQLSLSYQNSPLSVDLDATTGIRAGDRAPDAPCVDVHSRQEVRLFDIYRGTHFTLLLFGDQVMPPLPSEYLGYLHICRITPPGTDTHDNALIDMDGHAYKAYGVNDDALILVRPDKYIGLIGSSADPQPILDYLRNVIGH
jgi:hypothetical protein